ncbi:hypothetical protein HZU75_06525 [Chitinibacter fontanus]|uniref:Uncharacterized protein n=1 Tax=Chitinibacter fontanus TaxID=1737446 RepID=A0A7D5VA68_9NEIS|nr:hypothetical protein [Chitinibacter fontanus]QLI81213.1 hypothetical protein HZU75_06525 [Chitinibacter fontanus]
MDSCKLILAEILKSVSAYREGNLSLIGIINRLEELNNALTSVSFNWGFDIEDYLLELDIIYGLLSVSEKKELSKDDKSDIDKYLTDIYTRASTELDLLSKSL